MSSIVPSLYQSVIDDVINSVRDAFLDDGLDEQVLAELKQTWERKLFESKIMDVVNLRINLQLLNIIKFLSFFLKFRTMLVLLIKTPAHQPQTTPHNHQASRQHQPQTVCSFVYSHLKQKLMSPTFLIILIGTNVNNSTTSSAAGLYCVNAN